jgi:hypothetical protein
MSRYHAPMKWIAASLLLAAPALGHSGVLDEKGCHDGREGQQHCHRSGEAGKPARPVSLSHKEIAAEFQKGAEAYRSCFKEEFARSKAAKSISIRLQFELTKLGLARKVSIRTAASARKPGSAGPKEVSKPLQDCLQAALAMRRWREFSGASKSIVYPMQAARPGPGERLKLAPLKITFKGSLSREEIQRVIKAAQSEIRFCYERELQTEPDLSGKIVLAWTITGQGSVANAKVSSSTIRNEKVGACLREVVSGLQFPEPRGGGSVFVTYPWVFSAK